jgi:hypothetical protein
MARKTGTVSYAELWALLEKRYPKREYALLPEVRNGTGFARATRTADALALSLWPSRGIDLHGIEIKASRGDWKRELAQPEKAHEIGKFCDYWWVAVTDAAILPLDELPKNWGLLAPSADGSTLLTVKQAPRMEDAAPLSNLFIAAILRKVSDSTVPAATLTAKLQAEYLRGKADALNTVKDTAELDRLRAVEAAVKAFEAASGVSIASTHHWQRVDPKKAGEAVKALVNGSESLERQVDHLDSVARVVGHLQHTVTSQIAAIREAAAVMQNRDGA